MSGDSEWVVGTGDGVDFRPLPDLPSFPSTKSAAAWARDHAPEYQGLKWRRVSTSGHVPTYRQMIGSRYVTETTALGNSSSPPSVRR